jgi:hypothetical protein
MIRSLDEAVHAGEPLIDIVVVFKEGVDFALATERANALGPDLELDRRDWHGEPRFRIGQVTAEGMLRLFRVRIRRVPLEKWDEQANAYVGVHERLFRWDQHKIVQWPQELRPFLESVGITQPGADDNGQAYIPLFDT